MTSKKNHFSLTLALIFFVFIMMIISFIVVGGIILLLVKTNLIAYVPRFSHRYKFFGPFILIFFVSILMGTMLTALFSRKTLAPFKRAITAINQVANGDFNVTLEYQHGPYELIQLSQSFNQMTKELSGIETLRSDFINHFSHEFKTPIVSIQGFAKLLKNPSLPESEQQKYIDIIIQEATRLTSLSSNILTLTKVENLEIMPEITTIQLDEQLRQTILLLEPKWQPKRIQFKLELEETLVASNEELLQQVWINLLDNAIKFSHKDGLIILHLNTFNEQVMIQICDQGCGMTTETQQHLFNKFYQGDSSHSQEGNGLGLPLVKRIIQLVHGEITLQSSPNSGTTITILLPKLNQKL